jgi:D-inositol-3-phosphate glycosyltransferase
MRIALISEQASPLAALGGIDAGRQNIYVAHVAHCLVKLGHSVDVYTRRDDVRQPPVVQVEPGLRVLQLAAGPARFVPNGELRRYLPEFADCCEHLCASGPGYDVAHANFYMAGGVALQLKRNLGLPFVLSLHRLGLVQCERSHHAIASEQAIVREAAAIIVGCAQDHADLVRLHGADTTKMTILPYGFEHAQCATLGRADARRELGLDPGAFIVLQPARLAPREGIENLVRAMALLPRRVRPGLLVVDAGSGAPNEQANAEITRLRGIARALAVEDLPSFIGSQPRHRWPLYCAASNVLVSMPWHATHASASLEAMACGTPVIVSAAGSLQHSVVDGLTGYVVPPNDPQALAEHLLYLHAHPALAHALGAAGMRHAHTLHEWEHVSAQLRATYRDLTAACAPSAPRATATASCAA